MERRKFSREFKFEAVRLMKDRGVSRQSFAGVERPVAATQLGETFADDRSKPFLAIAR